MRFLLLLTWALIVAMGVGAGSAYYLIKDDSNLGSVTVGNWQVWPMIGQAEADPYSLALRVRARSIPLGAAEGLAFTAKSIAPGQPLERACSYRLVGQIPRSRIWTLVLTDLDGTPLISQDEPPKLAGVHSKNVVRQADGAVRISIGPQAKPGNWIRQTGSGPFKIILRIYDTELNSTDQFESPDMPQLIQEKC